MKLKLLIKLKENKYNEYCKKFKIIYFIFMNKFSLFKNDKY